MCMKVRMYNIDNSRISDNEQFGAVLCEIGMGAKRMIEMTGGESFNDFKKKDSIRDIRMRMYMT